MNKHVTHWTLMILAILATSAATPSLAADDEIGRAHV